MLKGFWGHIQTEGPHSGSTAPQESAFRLRTATAIAQYLIHRSTPSKKT
jgi:hypothetical protein